MVYGFIEAVKCIVDKSTVGRPVRRWCIFKLINRNEIVYNAYK